MCPVAHSGGDGGRNARGNSYEEGGCSYRRCRRWSRCAVAQRRCRLGTALNPTSRPAALPPFSCRPAHAEERTDAAGVASVSGVRPGDLLAGPRGRGCRRERSTTAPSWPALGLFAALMIYSEHRSVEFAEGAVISAGFMVMVASVVAFNGHGAFLGPLLVGLSRGLYVPQLRDRKWALIAVNSASAGLATLATAIAYERLPDAWTCRDAPSPARRVHHRGDLRGRAVADPRRRDPAAREDTSCAS